MYMSDKKDKVKFGLFCLTAAISIITLIIYIVYINKVPPYTSDYDSFYFSVLSCYTLWPLGTFCAAYAVTYLLKPTVNLQCKKILLILSLCIFIVYALIILLFTISNFTSLRTFANDIMGNYFIRTHLQFNAKTYTMFLGFITGLTANSR